MRPRKELAEVGYVNFGYFSPELSSESEYPDYIRKNAIEVADKVRCIQNEESITFAFMTDIHYSRTANHDIRTKRLMNAYREIKEKVKIQKLVFGGDYVNDGTKEYKTDNYEGLKMHLGDEPYFPANGNHDDNTVWDLYLESESSTQHLTTEELREIFYGHLEKNGAKFDEKNPALYYYIDDNTSKLRYVFLDTSDIPCRYDKNGKLIYTKQYILAVSQRQADWLVNEALAFQEDGWSVVFVAHKFALSNHHDERKIQVVNDILDAYKKGENLNREYGKRDFYVKVDADFKNRKRADIIACFAGHHHADIVQYTPSGIPLIFTGCTIMYKTGRNDGEISELLFDVVTINKDERTIYITRMGTGEDRKVKY